MEAARTAISSLAIIARQCYRKAMNTGAPEPEADITTSHWREGDVALAAEALKRGGLVAFPTETVYGLGGDGGSDRAVAAIYVAKGRPQFNPLILHVTDAEAAERLAEFSPGARLLAERFWPGPLSLVVRQRAGARVSKLASAGLPNIALRAPAHPLARKLLAAFGGPVAAPSANPSGRISPTIAAHVFAGLGGRIAGVLDGGACSVGLESTIVGFDGETPVLLRPGGLATEEIEDVLSRPLARAGEAITAPGQLLSHYAPRARMRLNALHAEPSEHLLGFGGSPGAALDLSKTGDLEEAAANLFAMLHRLDEEAERIAVSPVPEAGLGRAINDRLRRAAAPRPGEVP